MYKSLTIFICFLLITGNLAAQTANTLSSKEKQEGWKLLFSGKDLKGWHAYGGKETGSAWKIEQGALKLDVPERAGNKAKNGGDIVTDDEITGDFEFKADWKISKYANSGIFFFVSESPQNPKMHSTGLELQVTDNTIYEGAKENTHRAGDFFGIANARLREINPVGEWNQVHFIVRNNKLTVTLNGFIVQEHDIAGEDWKKRVSESSLAKAPIGRGIYKGRIGLQDWGSTVWYRNVKIRKL